MPELQLNKDQCIICDGDSLTNFRGGPGYSTWPYMRMMNWDRNWGDIIAEHLFSWYPQLHIHMRNVAVGGSTSQSVLQRFDECVAPHKPDWVLMTIGANDISHEMPLSETQSAVTAYMEKLTAVSGGRLVVVGGFEICPHAPQRRRDRQPALDERFAAIREMLEAADGIALNIGAGMRAKAEELQRQYDGHSVYCTGDSHFSYLGNMIIAGEVMRAMGLVADVSIIADT